jgi:hypothetical protein
MVFIVVVKQALDSHSNNSTKFNFELLYDIKVFYGLAMLLPMLKRVNSLTKLAQAQNVFFLLLALPTQARILCLDSLYNIAG